MRSFITIILLLFFSIICYAQTIKEFEAKLETCNKQISELNEKISRISSKYDSFMVNGEIKDRDESLSVLQVWGTAIPTDNNYNAYGARLESSNIYIINPDKDKINYNYYIGGVHFFREKKYGKNAFGADVPIFVFGDMKDEADAIVYRTSVFKKKQLLSEKSDLTDKLNSLRITSIFSEGDLLLEQRKYDESITTFKKGLLLGDDYKESALNKIWDALIKKSNNLCESNKYQQAIENLNNFTEYDNSYESKDKIKVEQSKIFEKEAGYYSSSANYFEAIDRLDKSKELNGKPSDKWFRLYAESNFNLGMAEIKYSKIESGVRYLSIASKIDYNYRVKAKAELDKMKRSETSMAIASIIPGLGQYIQGEYLKGLLFTSGVSFLIYNGIQRGNEGLSEKQSNNFLYAGLFLVYGIWDSYSTANNFNNSINLNDNIQITYLGNYLNLSVKL